MTRFFGLVLAVVATVQSANAALLSTWGFEGNANGSSTTGTPGAFINNGVDGVGSHGIKYSTWVLVIAVCSTPSKIPRP